MRLRLEFYAVLIVAATVVLAALWLGARVDELLKIWTAPAGGQLWL